jgi:hypothetical protein
LTLRALAARKLHDATDDMTVAARRGVARAGAPRDAARRAFAPNAAIRRHASDIMSQGLEHAAWQGGVLASLLELKHFIGGLPSR